ncbi:hypothetical protein JTZ62_05275 [Mammaliicoccus sciuri]|uniref:hypothetical protein n=1 Tax=Mammaliicoccus sciuri TaxID=1296 RepID=UPI0019D3D3E9|nr:hypothetical protein [Mammaliicoccus sciuri]QSN68568.1 hypothetical protein JTZ62_05275 [Mammaliicoccus sciuri]UIU23313.1 hypothetical protein LLZ87_05290 [Mammaliicoccus sciuri]UIU26219.1 hypothetical protein LLZ92_05290 [Mammaliicoccus sciuri]
MKDRVQFVIIALLGIVAFIIFFGFVLSNIDPNNKLEAYTLAISFVGVFATFGGAYLGARLAGEYTLETVKKQNEYSQNRKNIKIKNKATIALIDVMNESNYLSKHLQNIYEQNNVNILISNDKIIDIFAKPFVALANENETYESDKSIYISILHYISECNRMRNYSMHSVSNYELNDDIRDYYLSNTEITKRNEMEKSTEKSIADAFIVYNILLKEIEKLKENICETELYESIGIIDEDNHELRFYNIDFKN